MGGGKGAGGPLNQIAAIYSRAYGVAVTKLLGTEGGFVDDPADRGGATKYGISLRFLIAEGQIDANQDGFADFDFDMDGDIDGADIRKLTLVDAVSLYHRCFWQPLACDTFPAPIGEMLFDQAVNGGALAAKKLLQRAINACAVHLPDSPRIRVDGAIGPATMGALHSVLEHPGLGMPAVAEAYREAARARYRAIVAADPTQKRFLTGWLARADALGRDA